MASGDMVNTAARMRAAAPVDFVLVDESTGRATTAPNYSLTVGHAAYQCARAARQSLGAWLFSARLALRAAGDRALSLNDYEGRIAGSRSTSRRR